MKDPNIPMFIGINPCHFPEVNPRSPIDAFYAVMVLNLSSFHSSFEIEIVRFIIFRNRLFFTEKKIMIHIKLFIRSFNNSEAQS